MFFYPFEREDRKPVTFELTDEDREALTRLFASGKYSELEPIDRYRLEFARWLVEHGKLDEGVTHA